MVGNLGATDVRGPDRQPKSRLLFAAGTDGELYTVNRHTGAATRIGLFGHPRASMGDLAFIGKHLYATVFRPPNTKTLLARVNIHTGKATVIGRTGFSATSMASSPPSGTCSARRSTAPSSPSPPRPATATTCPTPHSPSADSRPSPLPRPPSGS